MVCLTSRRQIVNQLSRNPDLRKRWVSCPCLRFIFSSRSLMLWLGIDQAQYDRHCCPPSHVVSLGIDRNCIESFQNLCMMSTLPGGATAKPVKTFYDNPHNIMYVQTVPELCLKMIVIGGPERVYKIGRNFRKGSIELTHNAEFSVWEFYTAYLD